MELWTCRSMLHPAGPLPEQMLVFRRLQESRKFWRNLKTQGPRGRHLRKAFDPELCRGHLRFGENLSSTRLLRQGLGQVKAGLAKGPQGVKDINRHKRLLPSQSYWHVWIWGETPTFLYVWWERRLCISSVEIMLALEVRLLFNTLAYVVHCFRCIRWILPRCYSL